VSGDIIALGISAATPAGALLEVTAVADAGSTIVLDTAPASVFDEYPEFALSHPADFHLSDEPISILCGGGATIKATLGVDAHADFDVAWSNPFGSLSSGSFLARFIHVHMHLSGTEQGQIHVVAGTHKVPADCQARKDVTIAMGTPFLLPGTPFVVSMAVTLELSAHIGTAVRADINAGERAGADVTFPSSRNQFHPSVHWAPKPKIDASNADDSVLEISPRLDLRVFGPSLDVSAGPSASVEIDIEKGTSWDATGKIGITDIEVEAPGHPVFWSSPDVGEISEDLGNGPIGGSSTPSTQQSSVPTTRPMPPRLSDCPSDGSNSLAQGTQSPLATTNDVIAPVVAWSTTSDGKGEWLVSARGHVETLGDATRLRSTAKLVPPVVGIMAQGSGYLLVTKSGEVVPFGGATSLGSMEGVKLNGSMVGIRCAPKGHGYWLFATDGGVFSFGLPFHGSMGATKKLNKPVVDMAVTAGGGGYWLVAKDGGVFAFGDAPFYGSLGAHPPASPIVGIVPSPSGPGYWLLSADGTTYRFDGPTK